jgi:hypothetical protein
VLIINKCRSGVEQNSVLTAISIAIEARILAIAMPIQRIPLRGPNRSNVALHGRPTGLFDVEWPGDCVSTFTAKPSGFSRSSILFEVSTVDASDRGLTFAVVVVPIIGSVG